MSNALPLWKLALKASPSSFGLIPGNFTPKLAPKPQKNALSDSQTEKEQKDGLTFYYASVKTKLCVDSNLSFSECLATAYFRIMEEKNESIFLQGNIFLSKLAKAILEKNEALFLEACEQYADDEYFSECIKALDEHGFAPQPSLYKMVSCLTEEFLCTKGDLPVAETIECEENDENSAELKIIFVPQDTSEEELKEAKLLPLENVPCSSDFLTIGTDFYDFLSENLFGGDKAPVPNFMGTSVMKADKLGAYKNKEIYINHRLALDALQNPALRFLLLLTMLHEYGHFLEDISFDMKKHAQKNLSEADFKFANFNAPNAKGEEQEFLLWVSDLSIEQRSGIIGVFEQNEDLENGNLKLPSGDTVDGVKFFGYRN